MSDATVTDGRADGGAEARAVVSTRTPAFASPWVGVLRTGHSDVSTGVAAAVRALPEHADGLLWFGRDEPDPHLGAQLIAALEGHDAAVASRPVTDAVKRVQDGIVLGSVDRGRLTVAAGVFAVRREAAARLLPALDAGTDPVDAVVALGTAAAAVAD